ncbi:uncharacterized protein K02A2.6-like [Stylophora pistillata]|nr:uncharacterized protein K02A2.6-like [Stylophora pistillata]
MVSCCEKFLKYQSKQSKEPRQTRQIPILPWQIVASDVLEHKNQKYLVVIDYYSKYIEAIRLNGKVSSDIIRCLSEIFSRHGYPQTLIADNMTYNSREMKEYATQYGINIMTTSPTYSQANGLAEKAVNIVKNLLRKERNLNEDNDVIDDSQHVTMQSSVSSPSVTRESDANLEPDLPDTDASSVPRRSTRVRFVPVWHKDYVM